MHDSRSPCPVQDDVSRARHWAAAPRRTPRRSRTAVTLLSALGAVVLLVLGVLAERGRAAPRSIWTPRRRASRWPSPAPCRPGVPGRHLLPAPPPRPGRPEPAPAPRPRRPGRLASGCRIVAVHRRRAVAVRRPRAVAVRQPRAGADGRRHGPHDNRPRLLAGRDRGAELVDGIGRRRVGAALPRRWLLPRRRHAHAEGPARPDAGRAGGHVLHLRRPACQPEDHPADVVRRRRQRHHGAEHGAPGQQPRGNLRHGPRVVRADPDLRDAHGPRPGRARLELLG